MERSTPENGVKKAVLDLLAAEGIFAFRLNTGAMVIEGKSRRFFQAHSLGRGAADILAFPKVHNGSVHAHPLWIEVKRPGGVQSEYQRSFARQVADAGHSYMLAESSDDVIRWLRIHEVKR